METACGPLCVTPQQPSAHMGRFTDGRPSKYPPLTPCIHTPGEDRSIAHIHHSHCAWTQGEDTEGVRWPGIKDLRTCFALQMPNRTYYLCCSHANEAIDWRKIISAVAFAVPGDESGSGAGESREATRVESVGSEDTEDESDEEDAMSALSSALAANRDSNFSRSESLMRGRLDTMTSGMVQRVRANAVCPRCTNCQFVMCDLAQLTKSRAPLVWTSRSQSSLRRARSKVRGDATTRCTK